MADELLQFELNHES